MSVGRGRWLLLLLLLLALLACSSLTVRRACCSPVWKASLRDWVETSACAMGAKRVKVSSLSANGARRNCPARSGGRL